MNENKNSAPIFGRKKKHNLKAILLNTLKR